MDSAKILYTKGKNDDCYTPSYGVKPIVKFIPKYKSKKCDVDPSKIEENAIYYFDGCFTDLEIIEDLEEYFVLKTRFADKGGCNFYTIKKEYCKLKYTKNIIWCPFDKEDSEFVIEFRKQGYNVIHSHLEYGQDFYNYQPEERDIIVSNPPFTNKRKIFERCLGFNKPFALLMSNTWLNDAAPKQLFSEKDLQLLMFDKRIEYNGMKKITFSSSYYCYKILPKQIIMERIKISP